MMKNERIYIRLEDSLKEKVVAKAVAENHTMSSYIRFLIREDLKNSGGEEFAKLL